MPTQSHLATVALVVVIVNLTTGYAVSQPPGPAADEITAALEAARTEFSPLTEKDLAAAKEELIEALAGLDARLKRAGPEAEDWRRYLKWSDLQAEVGREAGPDLEVLNNIYWHYASGHYGLGLVWFDDVRLALYRYVKTSLAVRNPDLMKTQYDQLLRDLPEFLERYSKTPNPDDASSLSIALEWLEETKRGESLVRAIRRRYARPNLYVELSAPIVVAGINQPVDEKAPVRDVILGADIFGTGHTVGQVAGELVPSEDRAELLMVLNGTARSQTVGYKGPARVYNSGTTQLVGRKRILFDRHGFRAIPAASEATTRTTLTGVGSKRGGRLVQRIACRRAHKQKCEAEWIAARHAERDLNKRLNRDADTRLGRANEDYRKRFLQPLQDRKLTPEVLRFRSTRTAIHVTGLQARSFELAAPSSPPEAIQSADMAVRVHESMVNNTAAAAVSGMIVKEEQLLEEVEQLFGEVPKALERGEEGEPWGITFAGQQPIYVTFGDNRYTLTVQGRSFARGEKRYPMEMNVAAAYRLEKTADGPVAVRDGELKIYPPGSDPDQPPRRSARDQVLYDLLQRRFSKIFEERVVPEELELPGEWSKAGKLKLVQWETKAGWMVLAWNRVPRTEAVAKVARRR
jgi:hypothetical protein